MYKLNFTLKQHTPLIHFQHEQDGATLRATEVKPKLDRFIYQKWLAEENGSEEAVFRKYGHLTVGFSPEKLADEIRKYERLNASKKEEYLKAFKWALDYKMRVEAEGEVKTEKIYYSTTNDGKFKPNYPNIFGNVETEEKKKVFRMAKGLILVKFTTFSISVKEIIERHVEDFFTSSNFGFRQSKGFGCFLKEGQSEVKNCNLFFEISENSNSHQKVFKQIELFYKCLKSGINLKGDNLADKMYIKSLMFHYAKTLPSPEQWDKRTIRHGLYLSDWKYNKVENGEIIDGILHKRTDPNGTVQFNTTLSSPRKYYYDFRDLLGLATEQDWQFYKDKITKEVKKKIKIRKDGKDIEIEEEIERFSSPILFKPAYIENQKKWRIYILLKEIDPIYKGSIVAIENKKGKKLKLEIYPKFDLGVFITNAILNFHEKDISFGVGYDKEKVDEAKIIIEIFKQLKANLKRNNHDKQ